MSFSIIDFHVNDFRHVGYALFYATPICSPTVHACRRRELRASATRVRLASHVHQWGELGVGHGSENQGGVDGARQVEDHDHAGVGGTGSMG
jgi:hypothetical protein